MIPIDVLVAFVGIIGFFYLGVYVGSLKPKNKIKRDAVE